MPDSQKTANHILESKQTHVLRDFLVSAEDFAAIIEADRKHLLAGADRIAWMEGIYRPQIPGIPGVENTDYSETYDTPSFSVLIQVEHDNAKTHQTIGEAISRIIDAARLALNKAA